MKFRSSLLAGAVSTALMSTSVFAGLYSNTYFFGDSITDSGAFEGQSYTYTDAIGGSHTVTLPAGARWTTNNADNYATLLAKKYGITLLATNQDSGSTLNNNGGQNYAQGGARSLETTNTGPGSLEIRDLSTQVADFLTTTGGKVDPNALYTIWIGGNDIPVALTQAATSAATAEATIKAAAQNAAQQAAALQAAGAKHIVLIQLPDFSKTPAITYASIDATISALVTGGAMAGGDAAAAQTAAYGAAFTALRSGTDPSSAIAAALAGVNGSDATDATVAGGAYATASATVKGGAASLSAGFNTALNGYAGYYKVNALQIPMTKILNELIANPSAYGIANVTGQQCAITSLVCDTTDPLSGADTSQTYLFADDRHPSPTAHALVAQAVASFLDAPYNVAPLANTGIATLNSRISVIDGRMGVDRPKGEVQAFAAMSYQQHDQDAVAGWTGVEGSGAAVTIGVDSKMTDKLTAGLAATAQNSKADYSNGGGFRASEILLGFFVNYQDGNYQAQVDTFLGQTRYTDIERKVTLGTAVRTETGATTGGQIGLRFTAAYDYEVAGLKTGPKASVLLREAQVYGFTEAGTSSTAAAYGEQQVHNLRTGLGWQLSADMGDIKPSASIMAYYDAKDKNRSVMVTSSGSASYAQVDVVAPDNRYTEVQVGGSWRLAKGMNLTADVRATLQLENETRRQATIGLQYAY